MEHPKEIGDRSTLAIMFAFKIQGWDVLVPFGENTRYDLVVDRGTQLQRVQCKTGRLRNGAVVFRTCSSYAHHPNPKGRAATMRGRSTSSQSSAPKHKRLRHPDRGRLDESKKPASVSRPLQQPANRGPARSGLRSREDRRLLKDLTRLLVRQDLPLHALQRVVDRLRVARSSSAICSYDEPSR